MSNQKDDVNGEKEDIFPEVLAKLANGNSHWYTINGDTSTDLSLCRQLVFLSRMDFYSFLFIEGPVTYNLNQKTQKWVIDIYVELDG